MFKVKGKIKREGAGNWFLFKQRNLIKKAKKGRRWEGELSHYNRRLIVFQEKGEEEVFLSGKWGERSSGPHLNFKSQSLAFQLQGPSSVLQDHMRRQQDDHWSLKLNKPDFSVGWKVFLFFGSVWFKFSTEFSWKVQNRKNTRREEEEKEYIFVKIRAHRKYKLYSRWCIYDGLMLDSSRTTGQVFKKSNEYRYSQSVVNETRCTIHFFFCFFFAKNSWQHFKSQFVRLVPPHGPLSVWNCQSPERTMTSLQFDSC